MTPLQQLVLVAVIWVALHVGVAGSPLRRVIAGRIGDRGFAGLFSLLSLVGLGALIWCYRVASTPGVDEDVWLVARPLLWAPMIVMPVALILFVGAVTVANPTAVGAEKLLQREEPAVGVLRITRHPMLWAFALWGLAHTLANGNAAAIVLALAIAVPALLGMASIDRKRARKDPANWARFAAVTSIVPFVAIAGGRNRFVWREIGVWRVALALQVFAALLHFHRALIGVSALPW